MGFVSPKRGPSLQRINTPRMGNLEAALRAALAAGATPPALQNYLSVIPDPKATPTPVQALDQTDASVVSAEPNS